MKKRILFLADGLGPGGAERQLVTIACLLHDEGYDVDVLCYSDGAFYTNIIKDKGIPIVYIQKSRPLLRMLKIRYFIRKEKYDVTVSFLDTADFLNTFSAMGNHQWKVVSGIRHTGNKTSSFKGRVYLWFQRYSDYIVFNSHLARIKWSQYYPQLSDKLRTIYNTVSLGVINNTYIPRKDGITHILVAASCYSIKNPMGVVNALRLMTSDEKKLFRIEWYGRLPEGEDNGESDSLLRAIEENHLENIFILKRHSKDIANKMHEADVVALFSIVEGLPNVICEGMTMGKPIIMSKVSDYELLVDSTNGFLCEWDDPQSIRSAILRVCHLSMDDLLLFGASSRIKASRLFAQDHILEQWIDIIEK